MIGARRSINPSEGKVVHVRAIDRFVAPQRQRPMASTCLCNWIGENCTIGPATELKSSFVLSGTKLAHFNFVGHSVLGADVNLEAGSIICNYRNERPVKEVQVRIGSQLHGNGINKFRALVGDGSRIGPTRSLRQAQFLRLAQ